MNLINDSYDFVNNLHASVRSLIPVIAMHGENLVGAEIGVWKGDSFLTLLQNCPNIKTLHGVDFFEPLKPIEPLEDHETAFPLTSEIVTIVLLNVD